jgi:hypothetical protein
VRGAAGFAAASASADGLLADSTGTYYVFAGGKAFGFPTAAALMAAEKADPARVLWAWAVAAQTGAPIAGGMVASVAGAHNVHVSYHRDAYLFKTVAQLKADGYGSAAAVPVPGTDRLTVIFPYTGT